jgi:CHASE1-domain containing sensor protein
VSCFGKHAHIVFIATLLKWKSNMVVGEKNKNQHVQSARPSRLRLYLPWMILSVGILLSLVAFFSVKNWEKAVVHIDFEMLSASHAAAIGNELSRHLDASAALVGLYAVSQRVDRRQFDQFAANVLASHADIQALMWAPHVSVAERPVLASQAQQDGLMNFRIHDLNGGDTSMSEAAPGEFVPILYVQPMNNNDSLVGIDLMAVPNYHDLLESASDTGQMTVSAPLQLNLKTADSVGNGVLLVNAVYYQGANLETVAGRRTGLKGYVLQLFRIGDLIEEALRESAVLGLDISVVYGRDPDKLQRNYFHSSLSRNNYQISSFLSNFIGPAGGLELRTPLDDLGKSWGLMFTPAPRFWSNHPMWTSWAVLTAGLLLSMLLAVIAWLSSRQLNRP